MSFIQRAFGLGGSRAAPATIAAPSRDDPAVEEGRRKAIEAAGKTRGAAANFLTSGRDLGPPSVARKFLLGQ